MIFVIGLITLIGLGFKKIIDNLFVFTKKIFTLYYCRMNNPMICLFKKEAPLARGCFFFLPVFGVFGEIG